MKPYKKIDQWLQAQDREAVLISKPENIGYLTNFWGSFGVYLQTKAGDRILLTDGRYREIASKLASEQGFEFILFKGGIPEAFTGLVKNDLVVEDSLTIAGLKRFEGWFEGVNLTPESGIVESIRRVKSTLELEIMRQAQAYVDAVLIDFLKDNLKAGITEMALKFRLDQILRNQGHHDLSFDSIVAFGEGSALPHYNSGERALKKGDNILIDCGIVDRHYCTDMTRNFVFGEASEKYKADYETIWQQQEKVLNQVQAGVKTSTLDQICRDGLGPLADLFVHSLGHGVGLEIHEAPTLSARSQEILQVGEVVTIEPGIYRPDLYGIRIEDTVMVQQSGSEVLTQTTKALLSFDEAGAVRTLLK